MTPVELAPLMGGTVDLSHYLPAVAAGQHLATLVSIVNFESARASSADSWLFWVSTTFFGGGTPPANGLYAGLRTAENTIHYIPIQTLRAESFVLSDSPKLTVVTFENLTISDQTRLRSLLTRAGFVQWTMDTK